jgi:hypothetical protein
MILLRGINMLATPSAATMFRRRDVSNWWTSHALDFVFVGKVDVPTKVLAKLLDLNERTVRSYAGKGVVIHSPENPTLFRFEASSRRYLKLFAKRCARTANVRPWIRLRAGLAPPDLPQYPAKLDQNNNRRGLGLRVYRGAHEHQAFSAS